MPADARSFLRLLSARLLPFVAAGSALVAMGASRTALADDTWTDPFPGVRHLNRVTSSQNIHVLKVDLCADGVSFRATKPNEKGKTTSAFAKSVGAQAAVNGDFFVSGFGLERGIAVGDGQAWPIGTPEDKSVGQLAFGDGRVELIADFVEQGVEPWMKNVVGGRPTVLLGGNGTDTSGHPTLCQKNPRTAVGLTANKSHLFIAVVDGRATGRAGMTCTELGAFMKDIGAHDALAFDGGGSSTMWIEGKGIVNRPSDGSERTVANHLALYATGEGPPGSCPIPKVTATGKLTSVSCARGVEGWIEAGADRKAVLTFDAPPGTSGATSVTVTPTVTLEGTCEGTAACKRSFVHAIPEALRDGKPHRVWGSLDGDAAVVLEDSPQTFTCTLGSGDDIGIDDVPGDDPSADDEEEPGLGWKQGRPPGPSSGCRTAPPGASGASSGFAASGALLGVLAALGLIGARRRSRS